MARGLAALGAGSMLLFTALSAMADDIAGTEIPVSGDAALAQEDRIAELERTVRVLADELERTRADLTVPEEPELISQYGFGPAASKVYGSARGISMGGYAEGFYRKLIDSNGESDRADFLRAVIYMGYKFTDRIIFNSEFELEHATTGSTDSSSGGSMSVEFATLDFLWKDWINFRAGLVLVPMGIVNELHEPTTFLAVNRSEVERQIIPSTWRENGAGIFGSLGETLEYKAYVVNGLNAQGFSPSGLRGGRQKGNRALAEHLAFVGRLDWYPSPGLWLGGSVYHGKSGQNQDVAGTRIPDVDTTIWELHSQFERAGWWLRALFTMAHLADTSQLTEALGPGGTGDIGTGAAIGGEMLGTYGEIGYDIMNLLFPESEKSLMPFFRFEYYDTQRDLPSGFDTDKSKQVKIYTAGLQFKPISQVVVKIDYRNRQTENGGLSDELNMGIGLAF